MRFSYELCFVKWMRYSWELEEACGIALMAGVIGGRSEPAGKCAQVQYSDGGSLELCGCAGRAGRCERALAGAG